MKYGHIERERRFLVKMLPPEIDLERDYLRIHDRYLLGTRLRLREITDPTGRVIKQKFAQKETISGYSNSHTHITNLYLTQQEYNLLSTLGGLEISKCRYKYSCSEYIAGIDVFEGVLKGLILAEVEFTSDEEMEQFQPPSFFTIEVTNEPFFSGGNLVKVQPDVLRRELNARFGS
jgi:CYTH domain-containing protein